MNDFLSPADVMALYQVIATANHGGKIIRMIDGKRFEGTVRALRPDTSDGTGDPFRSDVRQCLVHVTLDGTGGEVFWKMEDVVKAIHATECVTRIPSGFPMVQTN